MSVELLKKLKEGALSSLVALERVTLEGIPVRFYLVTYHTTEHGVDLFRVVKRGSERTRMFTTKEILSRYYFTIELVPNQQGLKPLFFVVKVGSDTPEASCTTQEAAEEEAQDLAENNPGETYSVLSRVVSFKTNQTLEVNRV